jgi:hypothetical protein
VVDISLGTGHDERRPGRLDGGLAAAWPYPAERSDKYARGGGVDTGSDQYPGAAVMSVYGAVYGGAGYVRFLGAERPAATISAQLPNVVFSPGRVQALLFGSGWGDRADGAELLAHVAEQGLPAVVDADGLRYLPKPAPANWLLTPHAGELARLLGHERSWVEQDLVQAVTADAGRRVPVPEGCDPTGRCSQWQAGARCCARPSLDGAGGLWRRAPVVSAACCGRRGLRSEPVSSGPPFRAVAAAERPGVLAPQGWHAPSADLGTSPARSRDPMTRAAAVANAVAGIDPATACAEVDLAAFRASVATLQACAGRPGDGCGEGRRLRARNARSVLGRRVAGAAWLRVATPAEALTGPRGG